MDDQQPTGASASAPASQQSHTTTFLHGTTSTLHKASIAAVNSIHHLPHLTYLGRPRSCSRSSVDVSSPPSKAASFGEESESGSNETAAGKSSTAESVIAVHDEHAEAETEREAEAFPAVTLRDVVTPTVAEQEGSSAASPPKMSYYEALEQKRARGRSLMDAASLLP